MAAKSTFDPARKLTLYARVGMDGSKTFTFSDSAGDNKNISALTFQMVIYEREGGPVYLTWTEATELSKPNTYSLRVTYTDTVALGIRAHSYFYILKRTDGSGLIKTWLNGPFIFHEGEFDGVSEETSELTINDVGEVINVEIIDAVSGFDHDRGTFDASPGLFPQTNGSGTAGARSQFDRYIISTAGTIAGLYCAVGTIIMALRDAPTDDWDTTTGWRQI